MSKPPVYVNSRAKNGLDNSKIDENVNDRSYPVNI